MSLQTKSLGSPIDRSRDVLRILAAQYRGRGVPSSRGAPMGSSPDI